jgi:hypothetical protein
VPDDWVRMARVFVEDKDLATAADQKGREVGRWGHGNEFELLARVTTAGPEPPGTSPSSGRSST